MKRMIAILTFSFTSFAFVQGFRVRVDFSPESEKYSPAAKEYQEIWNSEGEGIVEAMEKVSGVKFTENEIRAIVYEGVSWSGLGNIR